MNPYKGIGQNPLSPDEKAEQFLKEVEAEYLPAFKDSDYAPFAGAFIVHADSYWGRVSECKWVAVEQLDERDRQLIKDLPLGDLKILTKIGSETYVKTIPVGPLREFRTRTRAAIKDRLEALSRPPNPWGDRRN